MLKKFRSASQSWGMRIFFGILVAAFVVLWGVGDVFRWGGGDGQNVASIGGEAITARQLAMEIERSTAQIQASGQKANRARVKETVFRELLQTSLFRQEAIRLGLAVSDKEIRERIRNDPSFVDSDGDFDKDRFQMILRSIGMSEGEYIARMRDSLLQRQVVSGLLSSVTAPDLITKTLYKWQMETRDIESFTITTAHIKDVPAPSEADIAGFYEQYADVFTIPEKRVISLVQISEQKFIEGVAISEEELRQGLEDNQQSFKGAIPTQLEINQVRSELKRQKAADKFYNLITTVEDELAGGASLEEVAATAGSSVETLKGLERNGRALEGPSLSSGLLQLVVSEAYKGKLNDDLGLVEVGTGAYIIVRVDAVEAATLQSLDSVKDKVTEAWTLQKRATMAGELAAKMAEDINAGQKNITQAAATHGARLSKDNKIERFVTEDNKDQGLSQGFRSAIFAAKQGEAVSYIAGDGTFVVAKVISVYPPDMTKLQPSDETYGSFRNFAENQLANNMYSMLVDALATKYRIEVNDRLLEQM
ncbi:MAG: SurA N-terminal domain-containing protein [Alphaproteobacteria bacterium]